MELISGLFSNSAVPIAEYIEYRNYNLKNINKK